MTNHSLEKNSKVNKKTISKKRILPRILFSDGWKILKQVTLRGGSLRRTLRPVLGVIMGTVLYVMERRYLHIPEQWDHLQLLENPVHSRDGNTFLSIHLVDIGNVPVQKEQPKTHDLKGKKM